MTRKLYRELIIDIITDRYHQLIYEDTEAAMVHWKLLSTLTISVQDLKKALKSLCKILAIRLDESPFIGTQRYSYICISMEILIDKIQYATENPLEPLCVPIMLYIST